MKKIGADATRGHADLARHVDQKRILEAIERAEKGTVGTIHVTLAKGIRGSTHAAAAHAFKTLGFAGPDSTAVLFFVVPSRRELSVMGGSAVHAVLGDAYWRRLVDDVTARARADGLTAALESGIAEIGAQLARHFPEAKAPI